MICPECRENKPLAWFQPSEHCGDLTTEHALCGPCQELQRLVWAKRLELYFERQAEKAQRAA